jgi:hypothetical protein
MTNLRYAGWGSERAVSAWSHSDQLLHSSISHNHFLRHSIEATSRITHPQELIVVLVSLEPSKKRSIFPTTCTDGKTIPMKPSQNSLFKADTSVRSVAESGILGLVHSTGLDLGITRYLGFSVTVILALFHHVLSLAASKGLFEKFILPFCYAEFISVSSPFAGLRS